jgi:hypothetical protein
MFLEHKTLTEENAQLKKDIITANQASTYDNPESYTLSDEYKHHTNNLSLLDAEMNHWQEQLAHIRAGEPWNPLVYNEKGVPVIGEPRDPSVRAESQVMGALMKGHTLQNNLSDKLEELKTSHSNQHKEFLNGFQKTVDELFKGAKKEDLDKAMASKLPMFPRHTHSNPLVKGLATATALIDGLIALLDEEKGKNNVASIKSRTMVNAGPSAGAINRTGNAKTASVGDALKEFEKAKALGLA